MFRWPPTLDASPIFSPSKLRSTPHAARAFAADLVSDLQKHGFARLRNHGVAPATTKALFDYHRHFFALPLRAKLSVRHPGGEAPARGYSPWAYEKTAILRPDLHAAASHSQPVDALASSADSLPSRPLLDAREQFAIGPPGDTAFPTPLLAEELLPGFNAATAHAYEEIGNTCRRLVDVIEAGLEAPTSSISGPTAGGKGAELNLNFYPEVERTLLDGSADTQPGDDATMRRIWPHSDLGVISVLFQDGTGASGLELQVRESDPDGNQFAPLSIEEEGDVVLLVSDTLERWTNGRLRAAVHRVGLPPVPSTSNTRVPERRSAVMFYRAPPTANLGSLPFFVSAENPARYEQVTAEEYLKRHNKRLY